MDTPAAGALGPPWAGGAPAVFLGRRAWRALHPRAPVPEIEADLDRRWARWRGQLLADLARASGATALATGTPPVCPHGGGARRDAGPRERPLRTTGQAPLTLRRDDAPGTRCGYRLVPPGR